MKTCRVCDRSLGPRHFATPRTYTCYECRERKKRAADRRCYHAPDRTIARAIERETETRYRIQQVYQLLLRHGPQTSVSIAEIISITRRMATDVLRELNKHGGSEYAGQVKHPEFKCSYLKVWQAADCWNRNPVGAPPLHDHKITITDEDERWMQRQRDIADARRARIAAINEVRARV